MGQPVPISLGLKSNPSRHSKQAGNARLINCFAEEIGEEGKSQWVITACPGLETFGESLGDHGIRDMIEVGGFLYVVPGPELVKVDASANTTTIDSIPTTGSVYMRRNRADPVQIGIVSDGAFYVCESDAVTTIEEMTGDDPLPAVSSLSSLDGYGILTVDGTGRFLLTAIDDFTAIDPLDEGAAESSPDEIVRGHELGREVYFFGTASVEAHQNTGNADFPFERSQAIEVGCAAKDSVCAVDTPSGKSLMFVAHDHTVRLMRGYEPVVVSTGEIENLIRQLAEAGDADTLKATAYSWGGRFFYALSCDDWTREYDAKTNFWHERKSYGSQRWRIGKVLPFAGMLIAGDADSGQLYKMRDGLYDEAGDPLIMEIIPPPVHLFPYGGVVNALYIDAVSGVGLDNEDDDDVEPTLLVSYSKDGGETWSAEIDVLLHKSGQTARRVQPIYRLGSFGQKGITFRFRVLRSVKKVMISVSVDVEQLAA